MSRNMNKPEIKPVQKKKAKVSSTTKWTRIGAAAIAILLAGIMLFSMGFDLIMQMSAAGVTQKDIDALKAKMDQAAENKKKIENELKTLNGNKKALSGQIAKIDQQISATEDEIDLHDEMIVQLNALIATKQMELEASIEKENGQYIKMKDRVRFMYENGDISYLQILLSADNFSDFLSRYEIISQISSYEKDLFEEMKELKESIALQKTELEANRQQEVEVANALVAKKSQLDKDLAARDKKMADLATAEEEAKAAFAEIEEEEDKIAADIKKKMAELAKQAGGGYVGGTFLWPLAAANTKINSPFGMRNHPVTGKYKLHTGTDIKATSGTKIFAANGGTVITSRYSSAYGNYVVINHGGGVSTLYAHMRKPGIKSGSKVKKGDVVGYVGSTGYSTGPHLHFEIMKNGNYIDPMTEFKKK